MKRLILLFIIVVGFTVEAQTVSTSDQAQKNAQISQVDNATLPTSSPYASLQVTGAGSAAYNGTYVFGGFTNSQPYWSLLGTTGTNSAIFNSPNVGESPYFSQSYGYWNIAHAGQIGYQNQSNYPSAVGLVYTKSNALNATNPAPTISALTRDAVTNVVTQTTNQIYYTAPSVSYGFTNTDASPFIPPSTTSINSTFTGYNYQSPGANEIFGSAVSPISVAGTVSVFPGYQSSAEMIYVYGTGFVTSATAGPDSEDGCGAYYEQDGGYMLTANVLENSGFTAQITTYQTYPLVANIHVDNGYANLYADHVTSLVLSYSGEYNGASVVVSANAATFVDMTGVISGEEDLTFYFGSIADGGLYINSSMNFESSYLYLSGPFKGYQVDDLLISFDTGGTSNSNITFTGTGCQAPTSASAAAISDLESEGCTLSYPSP